MADNNILIKITTEADLSQAQKQLDELVKSSADLEAQYKRSAREEKEEIALLKKHHKEGYDGLKTERELAASIELTRKAREKERKAIKEQIDSNKQNIKSLNDQVKSYKTLHGQSGRMVQQLRAMREALQNMEDAGEFGSKAFIDLAVAAGRLEDQIGDTQQMIRTLASDTKYTDAALGLGEGLAGSFYIATSGAELLGGEMEGLQQAFYKVQAAMSVLSGIQQVYNAVQKNSTFAVVANTAAEKLREKATKRAAKYEAEYTAKKAAGAAANGAQAITTGLLTKAQWKLNAAMAANPIGAIVGAIIALVAAVGAAYVVYQKFFSTAGKAQMELENIQAENAANETKRTHDHQENLRNINNAETKQLADAKARHASEIEMASIRSKYAKQRADETKKYTDEAIKANNREVEQLKILMDVAQKEADSSTTWFGRKKRKLKELAEAQQNYYDAVQKTTDLEQENTEAQQAAADAANDVAEARRQMAVEVEKANIDLMKEGAAKEIAQINQSYKEKLKELKGNSKEEVALRKALEAKQAKEIAEVRRKYAVQAQQVAVQEQKNLLKAMSQSRGSEADYANEIELTKEVAKQEAEARIAALDKEKMDEKDYKAQVEAIRLELKETLKQIDDDEANRKAENAKRLTDIEVKAAEARKKALNGSEDPEEQKKVLEEYYEARKKQLEENAKLDKEAVMRSKKTNEEKAAEIKLIDANLKSDLAELKKEGAQAAIDVDKQYLSELERAVNEATDKVSHASFTGDKLAALKEQFDAEKALNEEQIRQLDEAWESGALTDFKEYQNQRAELTRKSTERQIAYEQEAMQTICDGFDQALGYMQQASDMVFEALGNNVQAELDALDEMYTTDAEEAKKNSNKKYISEKEYEKKKAELETKQAKYNKAQAIITAAINTALAITSALTTVPLPAGLAMAVIAGAMGAAQIGIIASKPLAQYAKGRKGGQGEYALVGEKGAEIMYIPKGASIIPNDKIDKPSEWPKYGVPELPHTDPEVLQYVSENSATGLYIDYDKMGASFAKHLPRQRNVTVNVDRAGVRVSDGDTHTYLNTKYTGSWN